MVGLTQHRNAHASWHIVGVGQYHGYFAVVGLLHLRFDLVQVEADGISLTTSTIRYILSLLANSTMTPVPSYE